MNPILKISPEVVVAFERIATVQFGQKLAAWIFSQPELRDHIAIATPSWCEATAGLARRHGLSSEDATSRYARLRLIHGDDWLQSTAARDILESHRDEDLKVFQLECLHWGIAHD